MQKKYLFVLITLAYFTLCTILLVIPGKSFPTENWLDKIWFDKWVHIGMFGGMAFLTCLSWRSFSLQATAKQTRKAFILIGVMCVVYGILIEFIQLYLTADRSFAMTDIMADGLGAAAGTVFCIWRYIKK